MILNAYKNKNEMLDRIQTTSNFTTTEKFIGIDGKTGIAIDENRKKVCLIQSSGLKKIISYKDLISCEVYEDGDEISKTSRSSQLAGAIIGGAVFGGIGAVVGGLSGKSKAYNKIKSIDLRIIINDSKDPCFVINFLNTECKKDSIFYKQNSERAQHWYSLIKVLIKQTDIEESGHHKDNKTMIADEIYKLSVLLSNGIITEQEFQIQKKKLLETNEQNDEILFDKQKEDQKSNKSVNNKMRSCPYCSREISISANTCIFCLGKVESTIKVEKDHKGGESIHFSCQKCGAKYQTRVENVGRKAKCRKCNSVLTIPKHRET